MLQIHFSKLQSLYTKTLKTFTVPKPPQIPLKFPIKSKTGNHAITPEIPQLISLSALMKQ